LDEFRKRLEGCIEVERMAADFYRTLARMFPEHEDFWREMAVEEETHEAILIMARGSSSGEEVSDEIVPDSLLSIKENIALAKKIIDKSDVGISVKDAFQLALNLETLAVEVYVQESIKGDWGSPIVAKLKELLNDSKSHMEKIETYMKQRGL